MYSNFSFQMKWSQLWIENSQSYFPEAAVPFEANTRLNWTYCFFHASAMHVLAIIEFSIFLRWCDVMHSTCCCTSSSSSSINSGSSQLILWNAWCWKHAIEWLNGLMCKCIKEGMRDVPLKKIQFQPFANTKWIWIFFLFHWYLKFISTNSIWSLYLFFFFIHISPSCFLFTSFGSFAFLLVFRFSFSFYCRQWPWFDSCFIQRKGKGAQFGRCKSWCAHQATGGAATRSTWSIEFNIDIWGSIKSCERCCFSE